MPRLCKFSQMLELQNFTLTNTYIVDVMHMSFCTSKMNFLIGDRVSQKNDEACQLLTVVLKAQ
jgi:hypothetical protein